nr:DUF6705 family protein [uncultured Flavobacterium sp.]
MKRTVIILFMILSSLYCKAQVIMSIEEYDKCKSTTCGQTPDYIKDINGTFNKYVGTWKGTDDNKTYEVIVTKTTRSRNIMNVRIVKYDALLVRYKITDSNGVVLVDTRSFADDNPYVIKGLVFTEAGSYKLSFRGTDNNLINDGDILIRIYDGKMSFFFSPEPKVILGNPPNYFPNKPYTFPREKSILLTKQ